MTICQSGKICKTLILLDHFAMVLVTLQCQICRMVKFWISFGKVTCLKPFIYGHSQLCQNVNKLTKPLEKVAQERINSKSMK